MAPTSTPTTNNGSTPDAVCFGMLTLGTLIIVDELPETNTGAIPNHVSQYLGDDGVIAVIAMKQWGANPGIIGSKMGRDPTGRNAIRQLKEIGIVGSFKTTTRFRSPLEI